MHCFTSTPWTYATLVQFLSWSITAVARNGLTRDLSRKRMFSTTSHRCPLELTWVCIRGRHEVISSIQWIRQQVSRGSERHLTVNPNEQSHIDRFHLLNSSVMFSSSMYGSFWPKPITYSLFQYSKRSFSTFSLSSALVEEPVTSPMKQLVASPINIPDYDETFVYMIGPVKLPNPEGYVIWSVGYPLCSKISNGVFSRAIISNL